MIPLLLSLAALAQDADAPAASASTTVDENGLHIDGGEYAFQAHLFAHGRADLTLGGEDDPSTAATMNRARTWFQVDSRPHHVSLILQTELANSPALLDAIVMWRPSDTLDVRAGRMIVPLTMAWNTPLPLVITGERSRLNNTFAPGRSTGGFVHVMAEDEIMEGWIGAFDPGAGAPGVLPLMVARFQANPMGALPDSDMAILSGEADTRLGLGAGVTVEPVQDGPDMTLRTTLAGDMGLQAGALRVTVEGFLRDQPGDLGVGGSGMVAAAVVPDRVTLAGRGVFEQPGGDVGGTLVTLEGMATGYVIGPHLLAQLRATLFFPEGGPSTQQVTLHGQAWF